MSAARPAGITAVVFDYGGVLTGPPFERVSDFEAQNGLPQGAIMDLFSGPEWTELYVGKGSIREWMISLGRRIQAEHGVRINLRELGVLMAGDGPTPLMLETIAELHERGVTLGILTNNVAEVGWREMVPPQLLDVVVDSSEVGMVKPDPAIYELLLEKLGRPASEVAYFDDLEENIPPARALGINAFVYIDAVQCRKELEALGAL